MRRLTHLIILAALAVSAPAWGQHPLDDCSGKPCCDNPAMGCKPLGLNGDPGPSKPPAATPDELKAAAESITIVVGSLADKDLSIAVGLCAGWSVTGKRNILIGNYTAAPPNASGFVNIGNKLCFWRDTGERAACPAPEPECGKGK